MYRELGIEPSAFAVANHYRDLLTGFIMDEADSQLAENVRSLKIETYVTNTLMKSHDDRKELALKALDFLGATV